MSERKAIEDMTIEELKKELEFLKECLRDEEEMFEFMVNKSSLHLGGREVEALKEEHEEKKAEYEERIRKVEELLKKKEGN